MSLQFRLALTTRRQLDHVTDLPPGSVPLASLDWSGRGVSDYLPGACWLRKDGCQPHNVLLRTFP